MLMGAFSRSTMVGGGGLASQRREQVERLTTQHTTYAGAQHSATPQAHRLRAVY